MSRKDNDVSTDIRHRDQRIIDPRRIEDPVVGTQEAWDLSTDEETLTAVVRDVFENHWQDITFGVLVPGAAWEVRAPGAPERVAFSGGYATVDFGPWHFHLCLGEPGGDPAHTAGRRTAQAYFYRTLDDEGAPRSWGLRLINGRGEQQMTVILPSPFVTPEQRIAEEADFERLAVWDRLREVYLSLPPDPADRSGRGFRRS